MNILAIDPGNEESAWCLLNQGKLIGCHKTENAAMIGHLHRGWTPENTLLAVEMIASYGMAVGREVFETCLWIGRFVEAWSNRGGRYRLVYRKDVKLYICESPKANDSNIRAALIDRYGPGKDKAIGTKANPGPLYGIKGDEWAALAVALTAQHLEGK